MERTSPKAILDPKRTPSMKPNTTNLEQALEKATAQGLPILPSPFHRPFQYLGMTTAEASQATGGMPNGAGTIILDTDECCMRLEAEGNFVAYVEVELKASGPCQQDQEFDPEGALGSLSINPSELEPIRSKTCAYVYSDHQRHLKVSVLCSYDGGPLAVAFSSKYYAS